MKVYIEIGTSDSPDIGILEEGYYGIFVEAHPAAFCKLVKRNTHIQNVRFVLAAVSDQQTFQIYHGFKDDFMRLNDAFSLEKSLKYKFMHQVTPEYRGEFPFIIPTIPFAALLKWANTIYTVDWIRMDIEGEEIPILLNYDFRIKPRRFDIEFHGAPEVRDVRRKFCEIGYKDCGVTHRGDIKFLNESLLR